MKKEDRENLNLAEPNDLFQKMITNNIKNKLMN